MISPMGDTCVPELEYCTSGPARRQPDGLTAVGNKWVCDDCEYGYFWSGETCAECHIDGCLDCAAADMCIECEPGLMAQADGCIEKFEDCAIPLHEQPERLSVDANGNLYCGECMPGLFFDEDMHKCRPCKHLDEDCLSCRDADHCDYCDHGLKPNGP